MGISNNDPTIIARYYIKTVKQLQGIYCIYYTVANNMKLPLEIVFMHLA